jgi:hypothetical protein
MGQNEQSIKASVDPGEPEVQEMSATVLTPPHPDPFEALLDKPFAGAFTIPLPRSSPSSLKRTPSSRQKSARIQIDCYTDELQ